MRNKLRNKGILSTLDSDDEFPDEHNEVAAVPDYLNDWRFDKIEFQWLEDNQIHGDNNKLLNSKNNELILKKGVMNEQDLYCLKTIANTCPNILVWYTNFIIYKDLQLPYNFLQSCLVTSYRKF